MSHQFTYLQSDLYDDLKLLKGDLDRSVKELRKKKHHYPSVWAYDYAKRATDMISRLVRYNSNNDTVLICLTQAARLLNVIAVRLKHMCAFIALRFQRFYQQVIEMLPEGTTIQLVLFEPGEFYINDRDPQNPVLPWVRRYLDYWLVPAPGQSKSRYQQWLDRPWHLRFPGTKPMTQLELALVWQSES